jgi:hypothetical protein
MDVKNNTKCRETEKTLILYLYGEAEDPAAFEAHLERCPQCRNALEGHRRVISAYRERKIVAPEPVKESPVKLLWWERVTDFLRAPIRSPLPAGAVALVVMALFVWAVIRPVQKMSPAGKVPSYAEMEARLDTIDNTLSNVFTLNAYQEDEAQAEYQVPGYERVTKLRSDLENLRDDLTTF